MKSCYRHLWVHFAKYSKISFITLELCLCVSPSTGRDLLCLTNSTWNLDFNSQAWYSFTSNRLMTTLYAPAVNYEFLLTQNKWFLMNKRRPNDELKLHRFKTILLEWLVNRKLGDHEKRSRLKSQYERSTFESARLRCIRPFKHSNSRKLNSASAIKSNCWIRSDQFQ